jgi:putative transposase
MENFFGILKSELTHLCRYRTRQEAMREIAEYIEMFYYRQRRQTRIGFLSPASCERHLLSQQRVA